MLFIGIRGENGMLINSLKNLTKEGLYEAIHQHKGILSKETVEYLNALMELDQSIIGSKSISEEEMALLMQLELYQDIARYNIYQKALKVAKFYEKQGIVTICPTDNFQQLKVTGKLEIGANLPFYQYECRGEVDKPNVHSINLYQFKVDPDRREKEKCFISEQLDRLYAEKEYLERLKKLGAEYYQMIMKKQNKIFNCEKKIDELKKYDSLTPKVIQMIQEQESFCKEVLENYGIGNDDLIENSKPLPRKHENDFTKRMVKTYPSITVTKNIKYI